MPQLFHRSTNTLARLSIVLGVLLAGGALWLILELGKSPYVTQAFVPRDQPVQFSHKHHSGDDGIDCRYCHTTVEVAASAGMPATKTCMNCHSQLFVNSPYLEIVRESWRTGQPIKWTRVHDLPDFVYFNHSIHVNKGVGCSTCHGRVDQNAADVERRVAADGMVSPMPPQPRTGVARAERHHQYAVGSARLIKSR